MLLQNFFVLVGAGEIVVGEIGQGRLSALLGNHDARHGCWLLVGLGTFFQRRHGVEGASIFGNHVVGAEMRILGTGASEHGAAARFLFLAVRKRGERNGASSVHGHGLGVSLFRKQSCGAHAAGGAGLGGGWTLGGERISVAAAGGGFFVRSLWLRPRLVLGLVVVPLRLDQHNLLHCLGAGLVHGGHFHSFLGKNTKRIRVCFLAKIQIELLSFPKRFTCR